jgi:hypothetical protein
VSKGVRSSRAYSTNNLSDIRRGEVILGFNIRAGFWIDGLQILTSMGRKSDMFGNAKSGSG